MATYFEVQPERIRQIQYRALRKLDHLISRGTL